MFFVARLETSIMLRRAAVVLLGCVLWAQVGIAAADDKQRARYAVEGERSFIEAGDKSDLHD